MEKDSLYQRLKEYGQSDHAAFHMPGHKRQVKLQSEKAEVMELPWQIDITEIDGFDNLHHAEGILKESMDLASSFYGTERTLFSINGSTSGILSAIFAVTKPGDTILMARNSHKSVYHAVFLRDLVPLYVYPQVDASTNIACGYSPKDIEEMLISHPEIKAVLITSPTYEGVISDISLIADVVHRYQIPLIVDEAHGAHLTMRGSTYQGFPASATMLGADLVIQSLHKTVPALTQTAVLHVCKTSLHRESMYSKEAAQYMSIFQTSSPSYVLLASIDGCIRYLASDLGQQELRNYVARLDGLRDVLAHYDYIHLLLPGVENQLLDHSKIVLQAEGMSGKELYDYFRIDAHLQPEMCTDSYVLLMTSVFDTEEMYQCLVQACNQLEERLSTLLGKVQHEKGFQRSVVMEGKIIELPIVNPIVNTIGFTTGNTIGNIIGFTMGKTMVNELPHPLQEFTPTQTKWLPVEEIPMEEAIGRISAEYAYQYPPGIPLLVPGERIEGEILHRLMHQATMGLQIQGLNSMDGTVIRVIQE